MGRGETVARTIVGTFEAREAAERAAAELAAAGVPRDDMRLQPRAGAAALAVATDAILGSAVYDTLRRCGAADTEVLREAEHLTGWERLDPANDPPLREREQGVAADWEESSKLGTAAGAATGAATGAALGAAGGPVGALVGGVAGALVGGATGAAGDVAGKEAEELIEDDEDDDQGDRRPQP